MKIMEIKKKTRSKGWTRAAIANERSNEARGWSVNQRMNEI
jgi:hypothetical protein